MRTTTAAFLVLLAAACTPRVHTNPETGGLDVDLEPITQRGEVWEATLQARPNFTVSGTVRVVVTDDRTEATINVSGAPGGGVHPWHIYSGTCETGGPIVGDPAAYPPIQLGAAGTATASAVLSLELNEAQNYHINVHASPSDMGTIVACGTLDD